MKILINVMLSLFICSISTFAMAKDDTGIDNAKKLFEKYVDSETAFDPAVADLFADEALIQSTRHYPEGNVRIAKFTAQQYRALLKISLPLAKSNGDKNTYSQITYTPDGNRVRIKCIRFSELNNNSSNLELLVGPDSKGQWKIFEEISETQP